MGCPSVMSLPRLGRTEPSLVITRFGDVGCEVMSDNGTPWGKVGVIAGAVAAVVTLVFLVVPQLDPKAEHSGEITEVRLVE